MITEILINDQSSYNERGKGDLIQLSSDIHSIGVGFESFDEAEEFCAKFTKSMKIRVVTVNSHTFLNNDIQVLKKPFVMCRRMIQNGITGSVNEMGDKRMKRFYDELSKYKQK